MFRSRSWFGSNWGRPKNPHSLEQLKYLYNVLSRNQTVSEHNRGLLVESLRSIAEILIWGDQNDSSVFDFFLEKNMLSFFLRIMRQRSGGSSYVCVQLLQTLNILFENIRNETSLYYLLSNNHVNSIIVHKFDFSDEEVMAYYISFLKTLSLKLNVHTIHFFYNEHTNDFPLYTEAIKFFNHSESMVRIAVRTLTLNVYKVEDANMLEFIRDRTASPYFSNIVWFIGKHIQELDSCIRNEADMSSQQSQNRLADLVAEHLDHLHYLNDILCLNINDLNRVLTDHLLRKLFIPMYICSLSNGLLTANSGSRTNQTTPVIRKLDTNVSSSPSASSCTQGRISSVLALYLLSQVFLIVSYGPLVQTLAWLILLGDSESLLDESSSPSRLTVGTVLSSMYDDTDADSGGTTENSVLHMIRAHAQHLSPVLCQRNVTDEEKLATSMSHDRLANDVVVTPEVVDQPQCCSNEKPFLSAIYSALDCDENDYSTLFALALLYAIALNKGIDEGITAYALHPTYIQSNQECDISTFSNYNAELVDKLLRIVVLACQCNSRVRLVTLELCLKLLLRLVLTDNGMSNVLSETHKASIETARLQCTSILKALYRAEDMFLEMFENEYCDISKSILNVEWLCMDSAILLPPMGTPMTGIDFIKRLPCGEVERTRRSIRVFFLIRNAVLTLNGEEETQLPLTNIQDSVRVDDTLDLNNADLLFCTVVQKDGTKLKRFVVIDILHFILVEPEQSRLGWGVVEFVGYLQDLEILPDKDDVRSLHLTIDRPMSGASTARVPLLSAKFIFDDHIRCMTAKRTLTKMREQARNKKMQLIARILDMSAEELSDERIGGPPSPAYAGTGHVYAHSAHSVRGSTASSAPVLTAMLNRSKATSSGLASLSTRSSVCIQPQRFAVCSQRTAHLTRNRAGTEDQLEHRRPLERRPKPKGPKLNNSLPSASGSRDTSPRLPRPRSEEIPLELIRSNGRTASKCIIDMAPRVRLNHHPPHQTGKESTVRLESKVLHKNIERRDASTSGRRSLESSSSKQANTEDANRLATEQSTNDPERLISVETSFIAQDAEPACDVQSNTSVKDNT